MKYLIQILLFTLFITTVACDKKLNDTCTTPTGQEAKCIRYVDCHLLRQAKSNKVVGIEKFIALSRCGYDRGILVCCGSSVSIPVDTTRLENIRDASKHFFPPVGKCGIQNIEEKIYDGNVTHLDEFPWAVLLEFKKNGQSNGCRCGGSLINERYVMTAAHCVVGKALRYVGYLFQVRLGEYNLESDIDCVFYYVNGKQIKVCADPYQKIEIEEAIVHYAYNPLSKDKTNDIALLRLNKSATLNDYVRPICLPLGGESTPPGKTVTVTGWGRTRTSTYSPVKLKADLTIMSLLECQDIFSNFDVQLYHSQICAGGTSGAAACTGDSGGPLMATFPNSPVYYQEGIVSYGHFDCGRKGIPSVYTRVTEYIDWIVGNMRPW